MCVCVCLSESPGFFFFFRATTSCPRFRKRLSPVCRKFARRLWRPRRKKKNRSASNVRHPKWRPRLRHRTHPVNTNRVQRNKMVKLAMRSSSFGNRKSTTSVSQNNKTVYGVRWTVEPERSSYFSLNNFF